MTHLGAPVLPLMVDTRPDCTWAELAVPSTSGMRMGWYMMKSRWPFRKSRSRARPLLGTPSVSPGLQGLDFERLSAEGLLVAAERWPLLVRLSVSSGLQGRDPCGLLVAVGRWPLAALVSPGGMPACQHLIIVGWAFCLVWTAGPRALCAAGGGWQLTAACTFVAWKQCVGLSAFKM